MRPSESETEVEPTFFHMCATAQHYYRNEYVFTFFIGHCLAKKKIIPKFSFEEVWEKGKYKNKYCDSDQSMFEIFAAMKKSKFFMQTNRERLTYPPNRLFM